MIFRNKVLAGNQFDGLTDTTGLFLLASTGNAKQQVFVNSLKFHTTGGTTTYTLSAVDPIDSSNQPVILTDTQDDMVIVGLWVEKETTTLQSWGLRLVTSGMTNDGWLVIDYDTRWSEH